MFQVKPGSRVLLAIGLSCWIFGLFLGDTRLEHKFFDFQYLVSNGLKGDPPLCSELVLGAIDRQAFRRGWTQEDLPRIAQELPGLAVNVVEQDLAPFFESDNDGVLRSGKLYLARENEVLLAPPLLAYLQYRKVDPATVRIVSGGLEFPGGFLRTDSEGRLYPVFPLSNHFDTEYRVLGLEWLLDTMGRLDPDSVVTKSNLEPTSVVNLLQDEVDLSDKLVLLGNFLNEAEEIEFDTPTGHMVRLEIYASMVNSLLEGHYLRPLDHRVAFVLGLLFILILALVLPGRRTVNSVGWWMVWTAAWLALHQSLFFSSHFANQSALLFAGAIMLLTHVLLRSWRVNVLLQGLGGRVPLQKTGEEIIATILFTNLPDLIKDLEETEPDKAQAARAAHSRCVGYLVNQYGGRLVDLQGDAQMIAFGLEGDANHGEQAACCALALVDQVNTLLGTSKESSNTVFCGIVTGPVATGQVGGGQYRSVAAIGDTTNSAARLMGQAKKRGKAVLASALTVESLGPRASLEQVGELSVKGRDEALKVWEIQGYSTPPGLRVPVSKDAVETLPVLAFVAATILSLLMAVLIDSRLPFEKLLLDTVTPSRQKSPIIFAGLDDESLDYQAWPWPRSHHATIARNCVEAGAACVFLDFLFEESSVPEEDEALVQTLKELPQVLVAAAALPNDRQEALEPELLPGLLETKQWGLINHSPRNEGNRMRYALWEIPLNKGDVEGPGIVKKMHQLSGASARQRDGDFLIRWGPLPEEVSYHRLLDPTDESFKNMKGKVVIAGDNLSGRTDAFETPVGTLKGAVIHALSLQTLWQNEEIVNLSGGPLSLMLALAYATCVLYLSWRSEGIGGQVVLLVGAVVVATMFVRLLANFGYFLGPLPFLVVPCGVVFARLLTVSYANRAVSNYIPRKLQERLELDGTVADLTTLGTILLTDIRGYTTLSEGRSPSEILALLNSYHQKTAAVYEKHGGHLLTYQGDAQIVVFGPLEKVANPVLEAINAAQALPDIVREVAQEAALPEGVLRVGVGITTGEITLSLLGTAGQLQYSVFGAPVRKAHHLQSLSDDLQASIILDERSYFHIKDLLPAARHETPEGEGVYFFPAP